ncbi:MAG: phenylalanine--tRNA ligase subunit beta, partial [Candidatus Hydrothermarchaeales archaeon]
LLSIEGTARALRAFLGIEKGLKRYSLSQPGVDIRVDRSVLPIRGSIECLDVKGVSLDGDMLKGLMEMQEDLHWALGRDRKKVAIGVHDASSIVPPYLYKTAGPEEISFIPLGMSGEISLKEILERHPKGVEYAHIIDRFDRYPIILDSKGDVLSMPPIINGELTKVTEDTKELFVEMTGTEERAVSKAMNILASAFAEQEWKLFKVNVKYPKRVVRTPDLEPQKRTLSIDYTNSMLGLNLSADIIKYCLERMGFSVEVTGNNLVVFVPAYRADILHDIDIVEDVAIGYGYEKFDPELPALATTASTLPENAISHKARAAMVGLGFTEAVTLMLTNEEVNNQRMGIAEEAVKVKNPISEEHTIVRTHLIPSLLEVLYINRHRELPQRIFEVGDVLKLDPKFETGARKEKRLCACIIHSKANFSEGRAVFNTILRDLDIKGKIKPVKHPSFIPGRCAGVDGAGYFGELHPKVITSFDLEYPVVALEMVIK